MKKQLTFLTTLLLVIAATSARAADFSAVNSGKTIYYNITSATTVAVTGGSTKYSGYVVIPASVNNGGNTYSVTAIGRNAFNHCTSLNSVTIPNSVNSIGDWAFGTCTSLSSITIPNSVNSIGNQAFGGCTSLKSVTIPNSVNSIGSWAFDRCTALQDVTVNWTTPLRIYGSEFNNIDLSNVKLHIPYGTLALYAAAYVWKDFDIQFMDFSADNNGKTIYYDVTSDTSPRTVEVTYRGTSYGEYSNEYTGNVVIPATVSYAGKNYNVTSIQEHAFRGCPGLTTVSIPKSITEIKYEAFMGCTGLVEVAVNWATPLVVPGNVFSGINTQNVKLTVPKGTLELYQEATVWKNFDMAITEFSAMNNGKTIYYYITSSTSPRTVAVTYAGTSPNSAAYSGDIVIPATVTNGGNTYSVTAIGNSAFYACTSLNSVTIPSSVTDIGNVAFFSCTSLSEINIPNSVNSIGGFAFSICNALQDVTVNWATPLSIDAGAFSGVTTSNVKLHIPDGTDALYAAANVWKDFDIQKTSPFSAVHQGKTIYYNITSISPRTVEVIGAPGGYSGDIVIPASVNYNGNSYAVTSVGEYAFGGSLSLNSVTLPSSVTVIGDYAFFESENLASINIPNSVISIGNGAFFYCISLTSVDIPNSVISIGDGAFSECYNLAYVTIGNSVNFIGESAFEHCTALKDVTVKWATPLSINANVFQGVTTSGVKLHVPAGKKALYAAADVWKNFMIDESTSSISATAADAITVYATASGITVANAPAGETITVYSLSGMQIATARTEGSETNVAVSARGIYIVKVGDVVRKVVKN